MIERVEHHGDGEDHGEWIGFALSGNVGGGSVDGFEDAKGTADGGGGKKSEGAAEGGGGIGENVAEYISGEDDIKLTGVDDHLHGGVVDIHMIELYIAVFVFVESFDGVSPESGNVEDIGFIDAGYFVAAFACPIEGDACDAFDFADGVDHGVPGSFFGSFAFFAYGLAKVDAAGEFADGKEIESADGFWA